MADSLLAKAHEANGVKIVVHLASEDEDPQALSLALTSNSGVVAVLGLANNSPKLFVSRSSDVKLDCRPVLKDIMKLVGGGGGGKPDFAQGGGGDPAKLPGAMEQALDLVKAAMAKK
jgi:alanyl-tRNA synthetase